LRQRDRQTQADLAAATNRIHQHLHDWLQATPPATICAFAGTSNEINLLPLLASLQQCGWRTALPRIDSKRRGIMHMHLWPADSPLQDNRYGIPEPASDCAQMAAEAIDICLLPLLAFTEHGDRLGMGGGYYDRWLPQTTPAMLRVGVACEWQRLTTLPLDQWDQSMHYVCTESGLHRCVQDQ